MFWSFLGNPTDPFTSVKTRRSTVPNYYTNFVDLRILQPFGRETDLSPRSK